MNKTARNILKNMKDKQDVQIQLTPNSYRTCNCLNYNYKKKWNFLAIV